VLCAHGVALHGVRARGQDGAARRAEAARRRQRTRGLEMTSAASEGTGGPRPGGGASVTAGEEGESTATEGRTRAGRARPPMGATSRGAAAPELVGDGGEGAASSRGGASGGWRGGEREKKENWLYTILETLTLTGVGWCIIDLSKLGQAHYRGAGQ
jgi:hypothetical protein